MLMFSAPDTITLRTADPTTRPLPHPVLLQLHTVFTRLRKMCAVAGVPLLPSNFPPSDYGEGIALSEDSELDYQELVSNDGMPMFPENDDEQVLPSSLGLPLKERFLELLCGNEDTQLKQYYDVMEYWASSEGYATPDTPMKLPDVKRKQPDAFRNQPVPPTKQPGRKRGFELFHREEPATVIVDDRPQRMATVNRHRGRSGTNLDLVRPDGIRRVRRQGFMACQCSFSHCPEAT